MPTTCGDKPLEANVVSWAHDGHCADLIVSAWSYPGRVVRSAAPVDTDPAAFAILTESWRAMSVQERADVTQRLCVDVERLARAGIAARYPSHSEIEICHELARRRYGSALADAAYAGLISRG
jgi:hypothetical protein